MEYNPQWTKHSDQDFEFVRWQREVFKDAWKLAQAKDLFPILQVIATSGNINFNGIKNAFPQMHDLTLTYRLN